MLWRLLVLPAAAGASLQIEFQGQDTVVRNGSAIVFTTSVDDTSSGSDTDADITGDEEFFRGCLWTYRQQVSLCQGGACGEAEIMAHDLQRQLLAFYAERRRAPPLEEAAWLALGSPEQRREIFDSCPGLLISVLFLMAEALDSVGQGAAYAREAQQLAAQAPEEEFEMMLTMFPVREAWAGYQQLAALPRRDVSVDLVIARCKSPLQWLWEFEFPRTRVLIFDKCDRGTEDFKSQTSGLGEALPELHVVREEGPLMTGECTAYLRYLQNRDFADFAIFLHDDAPRHIRLSMLSLVLRSMQHGAFEVPFLHLTHERYPAFSTPCFKQVYRQAMGEELVGRLATYCCSHFVVSRRRMEARTAAFYDRIFQMVSTASYGLESGGVCKVGKKPCYVLEFLWHAIFGEPADMPPRSENEHLPLAFRYEGGRSSRLPSPLRVAPYMALFQQGRYSRQLMASEVA
ncbi:unnamed protein product [Effrenium voratum]|uniref:Uncharacterized protein n=1 Tax=Effrenium voratum TaxID=2562239 RepID=A0AA36HSZ8_9DINO|nr:unnamed protein product [Effrenium voratum]CAJ1451739.1 unnamed protein product [Effrenium voratum]